MSGTETTRPPEGADHREETDHTDRDESVRDAEQVAAAEAARRQARQDPLQG